MPQYDNDDFDLDNEDEDSPLIKQLRKQLKDQKKALDEAEAARKKTELDLTSFRVRDVLKERGITDKRAPKFLMADAVDLADEAAVESWLTENGDLFGYQKQEPEKNQQMADAFGQMAATESLGQPTGRQHEALAALENTSRPEDVLNLLMGKYGNVTIPE